MSKWERAGAPVSLAVNAAAFALGAMGGFCLSGYLLARGDLSFDRWLESYALGLTAQEADGVSLWAAVWSALRWPAFVWLLGFTALGTWMVPVMFALRGFLLCFCVSAVSGGVDGGLWLALLGFGFDSAVGLPAFFFLGTESWSDALGQSGRLLGLPEGMNRRRWIKSALALGCVAGWAVAGRWLIPMLLARSVPLLTASGL